MPAGFPLDIKVLAVPPVDCMYIMIIIGIVHNYNIVMVHCNYAKIKFLPYSPSWILLLISLYSSKFEALDLIFPRST